MFAVIGKKIFDRLAGSFVFNVANGSTFGSELVENGQFESNINGWFTSPSPPRGKTWDASRQALEISTLGGTGYYASAYAPILVQSGKSYICEYAWDSEYPTSVDVGSAYLANNIYEGPRNTVDEGTTSFVFTSSVNGYVFLHFNNWSEVQYSEGRLNYITVKEVTNLGVFPVIIPQGSEYPATTYEIRNVSNFMSKGSSLNSCDVSVNIACFADDYATTYNQAKAVVDALDLYEVSYTEVGQSYTAKFRFENLDDEYFKTPEKFYKNLTFNCLIIKN